MIITDKLLKFHPDYMELLDYLGPDFKPEWCNCDDAKITEEAAKYPNTRDFVTQTMIFCYQSISLWTQGIHRITLTEFMKRTADQGSLRVIDVGSGGGQTGLVLNHMGYDVSFSDISSQSMRFLEWRLRRHNLQNLLIFSLDGDWSNIPRHKWALCFDVLEHLGIEERHTWLDKLAMIGENVMVNLIRNTGSEMSGVHFPLDFDEVTDYISARYRCETADIYPDEAGRPRQKIVIYGARK